MSRVSYGSQWFEFWLSDKHSMISTMMRNIVSDLEAGYDPNGNSITTQKARLKSYEDDFHQTMDMFKNCTDEQVNRWCYYDMKKRGVID